MWLKSRPYILILPSLIIIVTIFFGGLILGLLQSLGLMEIGGNSHFTINAYRQLILSKDFINSLALTLKVALVSSALSGILAIILVRVLFILGENRKTAIIRKIFQVPMLVPHVTAAYLIMLLFMKIIKDKMNNKEMLLFPSLHPFIPSSLHPFIPSSLHPFFPSSQIQIL